MIPVNTPAFTNISASKLLNPLKNPEALSMKSLRSFPICGSVAIIAAPIPPTIPPINLPIARPINSIILTDRSITSTNPPLKILSIPPNTAKKAVKPIANKANTLSAGSAAKAFCPTSEHMRIHSDIPNNKIDIAVTLLMIFVPSISNQSRNLRMTDNSATTAPNTANAIILS